MAVPNIFFSATITQIQNKNMSDSNEMEIAGKAEEIKSQTKDVTLAGIQ